MIKPETEQNRTKQNVDYKVETSAKYSKLAGLQGNKVDSQVQVSLKPGGLAQPDYRRECL